MKDLKDYVKIITKDRTYNDLARSNWKLFGLEFKELKKMLRNTLSIETEFSKENFELNEIEFHTKYYETPIFPKNSPYRSCSNVRSFEIKKGKSDKLLKLFDIESKIKPSSKEYSEILRWDKAKYKWERHQYYLKSGKVYLQNKSQYMHPEWSWFSKIYLSFILFIEGKGFKLWVKEQLNRAKSIDSKYWTEFEDKIKNYPYLWLSTISNNNENYYEIDKETFFKDLNKMQNYIERNKTHFDIQNVWIESPKGKWRLICVPNRASRIVCKMWNDALSTFVGPRIHSNFHGFIHGRGCLSWWKNFIKKEFDLTPFIYEFDMASFFPNVNRKEAYNALLYYNVPERYAKHLINMVSGEIKESFEFPNEQCFYEEKLNQPYRQTNRNLPMGNPLCPLLSSLVLYKHFEELGLNRKVDFQVSGYADDNILLMSEKGLKKIEGKYKEFIENRSKGIILEESKSKLLPIENRVIKMLGLQLKNGKLYGSTRGTDTTMPSKLELKLENKNKTNLVVNLNFLRNKSERFEKYFGFFVSRLYIGKWDYDVEQDFNLINKISKDSLGQFFLDHKKDSMWDFTPNIRTFSSYCNSILFMLLLENRKAEVKKIAPKLEWKDGNDELYFRKYKELRSEIEKLPFHKTYGFYLWKLNEHNIYFD